MMKLVVAARKHDAVFHASQRFPPPLCGFNRHDTVSVPVQEQHRYAHGVSVPYGVLCRTADGPIGPGTDGIVDQRIIPVGLHDGCIVAQRLHV
jgi:hypothetical protein